MAEPFVPLTADESKVDSLRYEAQKAIRESVNVQRDTPSAHWTDGYRTAWEKVAEIIG